jgi:hypothetical protein
MLDGERLHTAGDDDALLGAPGAPGNLLGPPLIEALGCAHKTHTGRLEEEGGLGTRLLLLALTEEAAASSLLSRVDVAAASRLECLSYMIPGLEVAGDTIGTGLGRA